MCSIGATALSHFVSIACADSVVISYLAVCWPGAQCARYNHIFACDFAKYSPIKFFFTLRLSNKPFLIYLLKTSPHLKYVATLPCNLSLMACFVDINVLQGSVVTYARCGGIFLVHLTPSLPRNLSVKFLNRLRFDRIMVMSLWPPFVAHPVNIQLSTGFYCVWCELQHCKLLPTVADGKFKTRTHSE